MNIKYEEKVGKEQLEKLQKNRQKAAKARKPYWQKRIDDYFFKGVIK